MKVYILIGIVEYESENALGVFSSVESARKNARKLDSTKFYGALIVTDFEVDKIRDSDTNTDIIIYNRIENLGEFIELN